MSALVKSPAAVTSVEITQVDTSAAAVLATDWTQTVVAVMVRVLDC